MIRDQLVDKCHSKDLRRRFLRETDLTLDKALSIARAIEASNRNAALMESTDRAPVNTLRTSSHRSNKFQARPKPKPRSNGDALRASSATPVCFCCSSVGHKAKDPSCPAKDKTCSHCAKMGHFQRVCNGKRTLPVKRERRAGIRLVETEDNNLLQEDHANDDEYLFVLRNSAKQHTVPVTVHGVEIPVIVDSGASVNVLDSLSFQRFQGISLSKTDLRVYPYGSSSPIPVKGTFETHVSSGATGLSTLARFVVVENINAGSLLGKDTAIALGLLRVGPEKEDAIRSVVHSFPATRATLPSQPSSRVEELVTQYSSLFEGVGKLKNYQLKIHTDPDATPIAQPLRRTPFHIRKDVDKKLQQLADLDIIEDVEGPTPWVSPLAAVPKPNGEVRVCVDMTSFKWRRPSRIFSYARLFLLRLSGAQS